MAAAIPFPRSILPPQRTNTASSALPQVPAHTSQGWISSTQDQSYVTLRSEHRLKVSGSGLGLTEIYTERASNDNEGCHSSSTRTPISFISRVHNSSLDVYVYRIYCNFSGKLQLGPTYVLERPETCKRRVRISPPLILDGIYERSC